MDASVEATVKLWAENVTDPDLKAELEELMKPGNEEQLNDAFYRNLEFGTAGLRGTLGVGTNRMNVYVVAQATQGVANYLNAHYDHPTLALARDSRLKGEDFQKVAAGVLAANGVHVYVYPRIEPVPTLSFAVRYLHTSAGIVLTASHNPAQYNGYKVYNDNGGQIANEAADEISASIAQTPVFGGVKMMDFDEGLKQGLIEWTPEEVLDSFIENVKKVSVPGFKAPEGYKVVYTPLNGTGMECVTRILSWPTRSSPTSWSPPTPMPTAWAPPSRTTASTSFSPATRWASSSWTGSSRWPSSAARTPRPRWPSPRSSRP